MRHRLSRELIAWKGWRRNPVEKVESSRRTHVGGLINHWSQYLCPSNSDYVPPARPVRANTLLDGTLRSINFFLLCRKCKKWSISGISHSVDRGFRLSLAHRSAFEHPPPPHWERQTDDASPQQSLVSRPGALGVPQGGRRYLPGEPLSSAEWA